MNHVLPRHTGEGRERERLNDDLAIEEIMI
jgi:hypothetical protein